VSSLILGFVADPVPLRLSLSVPVSGVEPDPKSVMDPVPLPLTLSVPALVSGAEPDLKSVTDPVPLSLSLSLSLSVPVSGVESDPKSVTDPVPHSPSLSLSILSLSLVLSLILSQWQTLYLSLCPSHSLSPCLCLWCRA
jgi:hypothetical protein